MKDWKQWILKIEKLKLEMRTFLINLVQKKNWKLQIISKDFGLHILLKCRSLHLLIPRLFVEYDG